MTQKCAIARRRGRPTRFTQSYVGIHEVVPTGIPHSSADQKSPTNQ